MASLNNQLVIYQNVVVVFFSLQHQQFVSVYVYEFQGRGGECVIVFMILIIMLWILSAVDILKCVDAVRV